MSEYEYTGWLREYVPQILRLREEGLDPYAIAVALRAQGVPSCNEEYYRPREKQCLWSMESGVRYVLRRLATPAGPDTNWTSDDWRDAHNTHAMLLRLENLTYREIAVRLGTSVERARQRVLCGARRLKRATRRTKVYVERNDE